jgi:GGDEF domain-containing protein
VGGVLYADELRKSIQESSFTEKGIRTTVSIGVAVYPRHATTHETMLQSVKEALFSAQRAGRNKVSFAGKDAMAENALEERD